MSDDDADEARGQPLRPPHAYFAICIDFPYCSLLARDVNAIQVPPAAAVYRRRLSVFASRRLTTRLVRESGSKAMAKGRANDRHIRLGIPVAFVAGFCLMILQQAALARGSSDNNERRPTTTTNTTPAATPRPNDEYPIPLPYDERCPWLTDGVHRGFAR